jgi:quercetin dioxygenase-like cupin family protein
MATFPSLTSVPLRMEFGISAIASTWATPDAADRRLAEQIVGHAAPDGEVEEAVQVSPSIRSQSNRWRQASPPPRMRSMSTLHYTHTTVESDPTDQIGHANPDLQVHAIEKPYLALESEARWYGNSLYELFVPAHETGGKLSVFQTTMPAGFSPPRHIHTREDEVFVMLEGEAWFDIDGVRHLAGPGASVYMPRGVPHTFLIKSPVARVLGVITPGAFEALFRNLSVPADERTLPEPGVVPFDVPAVMAEQMRLGTQVVGPPMTIDQA